MNESIQGTELDGEPDSSSNLIQAYLRGELTPEEETALRDRLQREPTLRQELAMMRTAADLAQQRRWAQAPETSLLAHPSSRHAASEDARRHAASSGASGAGGRPTETASEFRRGKVQASAGAPFQRLLLPLLTVLVVAQAAIIGAYLLARDDTVPAPPPPQEVHAPVPTCLSAWVSLRDGATIGRLKQWMRPYGGTFAEGPDASGRIRLTFGDDVDLQTALRDPLRKSLSTRVDAPGDCPALQP